MENLEKLSDEEISQPPIEEVEDILIHNDVVIPEGASDDDIRELHKKLMKQRRQTMFETQNKDNEQVLDSGNNNQ